jgi:cytochrome c oxidase assembly protein subunit 15
MATRPVASDSKLDTGAVLAVGFCTAAAMWATGYALRLPFVEAPPPIVLATMLALSVIGGFFAGRHVRVPIKHGALAGVVTMSVNTLILLSLLGGTDPDGVVRRAVLWVPGALLFGAVLGAFGAWFGARQPGVVLDRSSWNGVFATALAGATFCMMAIGGLVTSNEAGMAVPDWPRTFGSNMFLYPLSRMTGGIYYEHAHRLFGVLVGLTTLTLCVCLLLTEPRRWLKLLSVVALVLVSIQGVMGGLRVTEASLFLAVLHGVAGQLFLALIVSVAAFCSQRWRAAESSASFESGSHRTWVVALSGMLVGQLALGAIVRHTGKGVMPHLAVAAVVATLAFVCGMRAWSQQQERPPLARLGSLLMVVTSLQLLLGFAALVASGARAPGQPPTVADVLFTTLHQTNGALMLAATALLAVWTFRLVAAPQPGTAIQRPA